MKSVVLAATVALTTVLWPVQAAAAGGLDASGVQVDAGGRSIDLTLTPEGVPAGTGLDVRSVVVKIDGRKLPSSVDVAPSGTSQFPRVLVVVDTSGSMLGRPLDEAKQAISEFVADAPPQLELGLMAFSSSPRMLVPPTPDRSRVLGAVTGLQAQGETSLYDAVTAGVQALGTQGDRRLVVLSDGADTRSSTSLASVLALEGSSGVLVDAIGFNTDEDVTDVLAQLASKGRGKVHAASTATELSAALSASARDFATALSVRVLVPEDLRGDKSLEITAVSPAGVLSTTAPVGLAAVSAPLPATSWWGTRDALLTGLASLGIGLLLATAVLLHSRGGDRKRVQQLLNSYTTVPTPAKEDLRTASPVTRTALALAEKVVERRNSRDRLRLRLERAAIALMPAEWVLLQAGTAVALVLLLLLLGTHPVVALITAGLLGFVGPRLYLAVRGARRRSAFEDKLPDTLQMTAASLSAGYSLAQAFDGVVREGSEPMATEIGRALAESRLGVPVETTLQGVAERMGSRDFEWVVMAIRVQREVGGNLAGVLATVSGTMRERSWMRRHVKALSAEGRLSAYILLALPISLVGYMALANPVYLEPLYTTSLGLVMISAAVGLMTLGSVIMNRMVKVEV